MNNNIKLFHIPDSYFLNSNNKIKYKNKEIMK